MAALAASDRVGTASCRERRIGRAAADRQTGDSVLPAVDASTAEIRLQGRIAIGSKKMLVNLGTWLLRDATSTSSVVGNLGAHRG